MGMDERWVFHRQRLRWAVLAVVMLLLQSTRLCFSLNNEGKRFWVGMGMGLFL